MELTRDAPTACSGTSWARSFDVEANTSTRCSRGPTSPAAARPASPRSVLVTQRRLGEDTADLERRAPRSGPTSARTLGPFERRKSSIYRGRPPFAMFGVGDYSFAPYKVAISGPAQDAPVPRSSGRSTAGPSMLDDTCYFLPCRTLEQAGLLGAALNGPDRPRPDPGPPFRDAKRPVTKAPLQRIDLKAILARFGKRRSLAGGMGGRLDDSAPARPVTSYDPAL